MERHPKQVTVATVHHLYFHEQNPTLEEIERILAVEELAGPWPELMFELEEKHNL